MEELVMALQYCEGVNLGIRTSLFRGLSEYVALASGRPLPAWKPVVGSGLFVYESEGRASGAVRDPGTCEIFLPGEVGLLRRYGVGKYSGPSVIRQKLREYGYDPSEEEVRELVPNVTISISTSNVLTERKFHRSWEWVLEQVEEAVNETPRPDLHCQCNVKTYPGSHDQRLRARV